MRHTFRVAWLANFVVCEGQKIKNVFIITIPSITMHKQLTHTYRNSSQLNNNTSAWRCCIAHVHSGVYTLFDRQDTRRSDIINANSGVSLLHKTYSGHKCSQSSDSDRLMPSFTCRSSGVMKARLTVGLCVWVWSDVLTLSLATDANLLAPTVKLLQPWNIHNRDAGNDKHQTDCYSINAAAAVLPSIWRTWRCW